MELNTLPEEVQSAILWGLDLIPLAFLVLDKRGKVLHANVTAKEALRGGGVLTLAEEAVELRSRQHHKLLYDLLARASSGSIERPTGFSIPRTNGRPLAIVVIPLKNSRPASVVFIGDPDLEHTPDPVLLARIFGFTPMESKVAAVFMQGKTIEEAANELRISENTTRNHLKRLFIKTNTNKQAELLYALLSSPAFLRF